MSKNQVDSDENRAEDEFGFQPKASTNFDWVMVSALFVIYFNTVGLSVTLGIYVDKMVEVRLALRVQIDYISN